MALAAAFMAACLAPVSPAAGIDPAAAPDGAYSNDPAAAAKQTAIRLEEVQVNAPRDSALSMAPTQSPINALQPQSAISLETIQNSIAPTADYAMIANLAPSVSNAGTQGNNGPGLNEAKPRLRGFTDGQYNVTFDGVPFGDGNDPTHHTTSYFPAKTIGRVVVDRGPGTAGTIGQATYGGTIAMFSKDPTAAPSFVTTLSDGSYNTELASFELNTGVMAKANNGSLLLMYQRMHSDGYRTLATTSRNTYFIKYLQPLGRNATITVYGSYNNILFNNANQSVISQNTINTLGRNFGQNTDPTSTDYVGYGYQKKHTDLEYINFSGSLGSNWRVENKLYTFSYDNSSHESANTNSGPTKKDNGGQFKVNVVRTYGDTLAVSHDDGFGTFKTGVWYDYEHGPRYNYYLDYNTASSAGPALAGGILDVAGHPGASYVPAAYKGWSYAMHYYNKFLQPFVEYDWRPIKNLTINPGLKYFRMQKDIEAPVNQTKDQLPAYYNGTWSKVLPLVSANYLISSDWSAYAQYAEGLLVPSLSTLQIDNPATTSVAPMQSKNYQLGTVFKRDRFNADIDAYWIDVSNLPVTQQNPANPTNANDVVYFTAAGAYYSGIETEAAVYLGQGLSVFANGSLNRAVYKRSKLQIDTVPQSTAGFGLVYDQGGFTASLMDKVTGPYKVYSGALSNPDLPLPAAALMGTQGAWSMLDLAVGYGRKFGTGSFIKSAKIKLQVNNLLDNKVQTLSAINANPLLSTYEVQVPINYYVTATVEF